jgi:hypothetical protein
MDAQSLGCTYTRIYSTMFSIILNSEFMY